MIETFKCGTAPTDCAEKEMLDSVEQKLQLYGTETADLIHQYYLERLKRQQTMPDTPLGQLTVRCAVASDDFLEVSALSATLSGHKMARNSIEMRAPARWAAYRFDLFGISHRSRY